MKLRRVVCLLSHLTFAMGALLIGPTACETEAASVTDAGPSDAAREIRVPTSPADDADSDECIPAAPDDVVVPEPYSGRTSPFAPTQDRIEAGGTRFQQTCARCHGEAGDGAGQGGAFGPAPADLTRALRSEDYLFWRISAGGRMAPFCSAMPAFGAVLSETARWELVAYVRSLAQPDAADAATD